MDPRENVLAKQVIAAFAESYNSFGMNPLMGRIIALLFISPESQSLDDIAEKLDMSKGPISQVCRRLKEDNLIEKVWVPGDRRDYYRVTGDVFGKVFRNRKEQLSFNIETANKILQGAKEKSNEESGYVASRMKEMKLFYELMDEYNEKFLKEWENKRKELSEE